MRRLDGTSDSKRSPALGALVLAAASVGLASAPLDAQPTPTKPTAGYCAINTLYGPRVPGGHVVVLGFAVDEVQGAPVRAIELVLDGTIRGESTIRLYRPDVLKHFARPDYLWSGWRATAPLDGASAGKHAVAAVAITHSGARIPCGTRSFDVAAGGTSPPPRARASVALTVLLRVAIFLIWTFLVGLAPALTIGGTLGAAAAPFFGLALFGVLAEWGGVLHVRPSTVAVALTALSAAALALSARAGRLGRLRFSRETLRTAGFVALFAVAGVVPFGALDEGSVPGVIDDAVRECVVADSISLYGWSVPPDMAGHLATMRGEIWRHNVRPGGMYLLSALADAFGVRAHEIHSVAMLAMGCLVVWGAGLLAGGLSARRPRRAWIAAGLLAINSVLIATLYSQHLGNLIGTALFLAFLSSTLVLVRRPRRGSIFAVALLVAGSLALYPESLFLWVASAALAPFAAARMGRRWATAAARVVLAFVVAAALNPIGLARLARFTWNARHSLRSPFERTVAGDTHYFPEPTVIWGVEPYREDSPAPLSLPHRALVVLAAAGILAIAIAGWARLSRRERWSLAVLLAPVALALVANLRIAFPYGYVKFLLLGSPVWAAAFVVLLGRVVDARLSPRRRVAAWSAFALACGLAVASAAYVVRRAARSVPSYDPAYRALSALGRLVPRDAVIFTDEPDVASREWMRYFLGEHVVWDVSWADRAKGSKYFLDDRRDDGAPLNARPVATSRAFALLPGGPPKEAR